MSSKKRKKLYPWAVRRPSLSEIFTSSVTVIALVTSIITVLAFTGIYRSTMQNNAIINSEQAVTQVQNMVGSYTRDVETIMEHIRESLKEDGIYRSDFIQSLVEVREEVVAVIIYDKDGNILNCWAGDKKLKQQYYQNLSYVESSEEDSVLNISKPHAETLFTSYYPWVVTIAQDMEDAYGNQIKVAMDIRFSNIANYVDEVGIGQHGYCFIADTEGEIVYHPQQQLIYSGIKSEDVRVDWEGSEIHGDTIYTAHSMDNCNWRIVGVCYVDEMITENVEHMVSVLIMLLVVVVILALVVGILIARLFTKPANSLVGAMRDFEKNAEGFEYEQVGGTREIEALSDSFGQMVVRIQKLMEKVRNEEITLRKTELNALQAQINPHFLYNTLDAIAWLCEDGRNKDAEDMVNALARLFRISISRGHELITIEKEMQHAMSYLSIQKFRYKNQFHYSFDVDEECLKYYCNKITLQPIIENAIYHGINRMVDDGEILIGIRQDGDDIIFTVQDNGVGMTEEQCQKILQKGKDNGSGIGIKNVNDRIKIYFGEQYGLEIQSELDEGTTVIIRMPKLEGGDEDEKEKQN